jgi:alpha-methylacyl-CoA racemase
MRTVSDCDVVIEGFTPGVARRLGVDYERCAARNPGVVYCSISSFGNLPHPDPTPGHDINLVARAGLLDQARDQSGEPVALGPPIADIAGGLHAAVAILAALRHRDRTGLGQLVDISLLASALVLNGPALVKGLSPAPVARDADFNLGADPAYRTYRTSDDRYVAIGALEDKFWQRLCARLGREDLVAMRARQPSRAIEELGSIIGARTRSHWITELEGADVCFAPVNAVDEVAVDDVVRARGAMIEVHPDAWQPASPIAMQLTALPTPGHAGEPTPGDGGMPAWLS